MKLLVFPVCLLVWLPFAPMAQTPRPVAVSAFMITRMAEKYHAAPRPFDGAFSRAFFEQFLHGLDAEHFLFLRGDLIRLEPFRLQLDQQVRAERTDFLDLVTGIYRERIRQADSLVTLISDVPMKQHYTYKGDALEDTSAPLNLVGMRSKLAALMGEAEMAYLQRDLDSGWNDTEPKERRRVRDMVRRNIRGLTQGPGGLSAMLDLSYCNALASCYDPHTEFFSSTLKEQFEGELGGKRFVFGFAMKEQANGVFIDRVQAGSPAFRTGVFSKGDQLTAIQWAGKEPIDLTDATLEEVNTILEASNHDEATFTIKKADGSTRQVSLSKEEAPEEGLELDKVKGWVLKGVQNIGYISLPAFYTDWDSREGADKGCAEDVAKEILELKKENIQGLILDLRYNGGGSLEEAIDLAGLFIDAGPLAQSKDQDGKPVVLRDVNRGTVFDGPLLLLVNGYSASASEVIAGSLQDYNRAIIIGTPTYGKATAQVILPLDTNIDLNGGASLQNSGNFIKLTVSRLYRVTGASVQALGVQPDVVLPAPAGAIEHREADEPRALLNSTIAPNKYYRPYPPLAKAPLQAVVAAMESAGLFKPGTHSSTFVMTGPKDEQKWLEADLVLKTTTDQIRQALQGDPYMEAAYRVACQMHKSPTE
ncbi:S41 family peptidase [Dinghuibacter silviterrae]|uniref:Carboxyl-terminal processing protease n=1 Tax=Dinghuibacter silviterrae TaxID=1539049 RepID=A0A4R8DRL5_9BACT|nr:S41 family peptidase [Dinghuibacter silviterrae]TDX00852.1 carboxyl-terminal processing protease [Dinghuibacter silviterrae]